MRELLELGCALGLLGNYSCMAQSLAANFKLPKKQKFVSGNNPKDNRKRKNGAQY